MGSYDDNPMPRKVEASRRLQKRAEQMIPGGVNSLVRAFRSVGGDPLFLADGYDWLGRCDVVTGHYVELTVGVKGLVQLLLRASQSVPAAHAARLSQIKPEFSGMPV